MSSTPRYHHRIHSLFNFIWMVLTPFLTPGVQMITMGPELAQLHRFNVDLASEQLPQA